MSRVVIRVGSNGWSGYKSGIGSFLLLLAGEEGEQGNALNSHNFEADARNISLGLSLFTETGHQHLVVFSKVVEATVPRDEGSDLLAILLEHDSDTLTDGGVGLFGLNTDLLDNQSLGHAAAHEGIFESRTEQSSIVLLIVPPA